MPAHEFRAAMSGQPVLLALDLGTGEAKVGLIAPDGRLLGLGRGGYPVDLEDEPGRAEQDPEDWWGAIREATTKALADAGLVEVLAVCCVGQGPTLVAADANGRPTHPAISWLDGRSRAEAAELENTLGVRGWGLGILPKALWLERHEPAAATASRSYLTAWEWIGLRLTGIARLTVAVGQKPPERESLAAAGLAADKLPPEIRPGEVLGQLTSDAAGDLGLRAGVPVVAGLVDAFASFLGAGLNEPGDAIDTGGRSGGFAVYWSGEVGVPQEFRSFVPLEGRYALGGAMSSTGAALDWFRDNVLRGQVQTGRLIAEAATTPPGAEGLIFLPYLAGERAPIWDSQARGTFAGLSLAHGRGHLVRAILEATAFAIRHVAEPLLEAGVTVTEMRICGGPGRSDTWNQIKADVTGFRVALPTVRETAVVGAAILASPAVGVHKDLVEAMRAMVHIDHRLEARSSTRPTYDRLFGAYKGLYSDLRPTFGRLSGIGSD
jgi:xylulokinase